MSGKLIIHIGTHKTGTTALQNYLGENREILRRRGLCFPVMPEKWNRVPELHNGYWLKQAALLGTDLVTNEDESKVTRCMEACKKCLVDQADPVVLSEERLWYYGTRPGFWKALREAAKETGADDIEVIVYLRRQDLFAESLWAQNVKGSQCLTITIDDYLGRKRIVSACDYAKGIKRLIKVFGKDNLIVRIYDRTTLKNGSITDDFMEAIGFADVDGLAQQEGIINPSLSPSMTLVKMAANSAPTYRENGDFLRVPALSIAAQDSAPKASLLSLEKRREFLAQYQEGNAWIAREVLQKQDGRLFPPLDAGVYPEFEPDPIKVAQQACAMLTEALARERMERIENEARLNERIKSLEARLSSQSLGSKIKRLLLGK